MSITLNISGEINFLLDAFIHTHALTIMSINTICHNILQDKKSLTKCAQNSNILIFSNTNPNKNCSGYQVLVCSKMVRCYFFISDRHNLIFLKQIMSVKC